MSKAPAISGPPENDQLKFYWNKPVSELVAEPALSILAEEKERHRIYSLLTLALVVAFFNGNKRGQNGEYPWRPKQLRQNGTYEGDTAGDRYLGHNIACIAVDGNGEIIDFEFNHNEIYNSSADHAEARLIRRIFNLNQIYDDWQTTKVDEPRPTAYGNLLNNVTLYTSLESCAQCSGIMTLANLDKVIFLQSDPGQYLVGNIMYNLTRPVPKIAAAGAPPAPPTKYGAPIPVDASMFAFEYKKQLDDAFKEFARVVVADPAKYFYRASSNAKPDSSSSITSFLCTDLAKDIFAAARAELDTFKPSFPNFKPAQGQGNPARTLTNEQAVLHARRFLAHAIGHGRRATPHR